MILSGEHRRERHRSKKALELFRRYKGEVSILITGSHSGLLGRDLPRGMNKECYDMADFLVINDIPVSRMRIEERSVCTLGNFFFSYPLIDENETDIELITDRFHMGRSLWCAEAVFGNKKKFTPAYTSNEQTSHYKIFMEKMQTALLKADFNIYKVKMGDYDSLNRFMREVHPFYCENPERMKLSAYRTFVRIFKNPWIAQRFLPTQKQAYRD